MLTRIIDIYVASADTITITAVQNALNTLYGESGNLLAGRAGSFKFCRTPMTVSSVNGGEEIVEGQLSKFLKAIAALPANYNVLTNAPRDEGALLSTRSVDSDVTMLIGSPLPWTVANANPAPPIPAEQATVYISSEAAGEGDGSEESPVTPLQAFKEYPAKATAQYIWLDNGPVVLTHPLDLYHANVEWVHNGLVVDHGVHDITLYGDNLVAKNVTWKAETGVKRTIPLGDPNQEGPGSWNNYGSHCDFSGCVWEGVGLTGCWHSANGGTFEAVVILNTGRYVFDDPGFKGHGPPIYWQNKNASDVRSLSGLIAHSYRYSIGGFFSTNGEIANFNVHDLIGIGGSWLDASHRFGFGSNKEPFKGIVVNNVNLWDARMELGFATGQGNNHINLDASLTNCYVANTSGAPALSLKKVDDLTITGSTFISTSPGEGLVTIAALADVEHSVVNVDSNAYYFTKNGDPFLADGLAWFDFAEWQAWRGYDANSSFSNQLPTTNVAKLCDWQSVGVQHLAAFAIYNWEGLSSVNVDLAALSLPAGDYELRQGQDYFGDTRPFSYNPLVSTVIAVDMSEASVAAPLGTDDPEPLRDSTFPAFGAFVIRAAS